MMDRMGSGRAQILEVLIYNAKNLETCFSGNEKPLETFKDERNSHVSFFFFNVRCLYYFFKQLFTTFISLLIVK